jgi:putative phosphoesterase
MKIGILSDTHNDGATTRRALNLFRQRDVQTLFHCGDLTSPGMMEHFQGFAVYLVQGNMDQPHAQILPHVSGTQTPTYWLGMGDEIELGGSQIAITHGDREELVEAFLLAQPNYLLMGHTHRRRDERIGLTRVINPGALGGVHYEPRSVCVLDLAKDQLVVIHV